MASASTHFRTGRSGNPRGRRPGLLMSTISNNLKKAARAQLAGRADEIVQLAIEQAASGDSACIAAVVTLMAAVVEPAKKPSKAPATNSQQLSAD